VALGIVKKSGAWFSYNGERLGQGRDNSKKFLLDNPEIRAEIEGEIRKNSAKVGIEGAPAAEAEKAAPKTAGKSVDVDIDIEVE